MNEMNCFKFNQCINKKQLSVQKQKIALTTHINATKTFALNCKVKLYHLKSQYATVMFK